MTDKLSATNFTDPLIQILGQLTGFRADVPVSHEDTYQPIMDLMGITSLDEHGYQDPDTKKRPFVKRWIGWAFRNARVPSEDGITPALTTQSGRGQWSLTAEGVRRARELAGVEAVKLDENDDLYIDVDDPKLDAATVKWTAFTSFSALVKAIETTDYTPTLRVEADDRDRYDEIVLIRDALILRGLPVYPETVPPKAEPIVVVVENTLGHGVQLPISDVADNYHTDPYIVALAIEKTPCFGSFSPRSGVCDRCPLKGSCLNVIRGKLAELAQGFQARLDKTNAPDPVIESEEDINAVLQAAYGSERTGEWDEHNKTANVIKTASDSVCYRCHEDIPKGSKAYWSQEHGMFHEECH